MTDNMPKDPAAVGTSSPASSAYERAGFCQECGRALTSDTLRRIHGGVFCPPCAERVPTPTAWQPVPQAPSPGMVPLPGSSEPNPVLAGMLGFIPGVGAMYNGQYAKGALHLLVFVLLVTLADNLNWVLWWLVWGWVFYQAFEAYHTARARRDGLPLPNPFGWNEIGERFGLHRTSPPESPSQAYTAAGSPWRAAEPVSGPLPTSSSFSPASPEPAAASRPAVDPNFNPYTQAPPVAGWGPFVVPPSTPSTQVPYAPTYTGVPAGQAASSVAADTGRRHFPMGALWLIGLGGLALMGNILPQWRLSGRWLGPLLLAGLAAWSALRRFEQIQRTGGVGGAALLAAVSGSITLFTLAGLLVLQTADIVSIRRSWPALLVVLGCLQLAQRFVPSTPALPVFPSVPEPLTPPVRSTSGTGSYGL